MVSVSVQSCYLLGFIWKGVIYIKYYLLFGLQTALFLFNLFVKSLYWILVQQINSAIKYYLNDFIFVVKYPTILLLLREVYFLVIN